MPTQMQPVEPARQGQRMLDRLLLLLHNVSHRAHSARTRRNESTNKLQQIEASHPDFANISFRTLATYILVPCFVVFAFIVDYYLDGPTIAYFARHYLASHGGKVSEDTISQARIALPLGFLFLDLMIAAQLYHAREAWADGESGRGPYTAWLAIALLTSFALAGLVAAAQFALRPEPFNEVTRLPFYLRVASVTFVAWLLHAALIFGGRVLTASKAFVLYAIRRGWLRSSIANDDRTFESNARQSTEMFGRYLRGFNAHRVAYPQMASAGPGPFDKVVRDLVNERLGYTAIQTDATVASAAPASGHASSAAPQREPVRPPDAPTAPREPQASEGAVPLRADGNPRSEQTDDVQAERDYLRDVLNQRLSEDESTVRA